TTVGTAFKPGENRCGLCFATRTHGGDGANPGRTAQTRIADARRLSGNFPRALGTDDPARSGGKISGGSCGMGEGPVHIRACGRRKRTGRDGPRVAGIDRISARTSRKKYFGGIAQGNNPTSAQLATWI